MRAVANGAKDAALYQLVRAVLGVASHVSFEQAKGAADRLGDLAFNALGETRRLSMQHLSMVFGDELSEGERRDIVRESLRGFALSFFEVAKIEELRPRLEEYVTVSGWEEVRPHADRGAIACSGHLGNWELLAAYFSQVVKLPVAAVARELNETRLNRILVDFRASNGVDTILRGSPRAGRQLLRTLKDGGVLAMLVDQDTRVPSITVPFLGLDARTPVAPATLAVRRNLPIVVGYSLHKPAGGIELVLEKPLFPAQGPDEAAIIRDLTVRMNVLLGDAIRRNPSQWAWWHRRWRRRPQPDLDPDAGVL